MSFSQRSNRDQLAQNISFVGYWREFDQGFFHASEVSLTNWHSILRSLSHPSEVRSAELSTVCFNTKLPAFAEWDLHPRPTVLDEVTATLGIGWD